LKKSSRKTVNLAQRLRRKKPAAVAASSWGNSVFLVGFMGAGKSSVGRALGRHLNWIFEDLDDRIAAREGRSVAEIFQDSGESEFRRAEHAALQQVLEELRGGGARIVALGGGTFAQEQNHKAIQASGIPTVFLDAPLEELWRRCEAQSDANRPLMTSQNKFRETHRARLSYYRKASRQIDTAGKQIETIAAEIAKALKLKEIALRTEQGEVE
jgi:shikimate kinase